MKLNVKRFAFLSLYKRNPWVRNHVKHVCFVRAYSGESHESPPEGLHKGPCVIARQELKKISEHLVGDLGRLPKKSAKRGEKVILGHREIKG